MTSDLFLREGGVKSTVKRGQFTLNIQSAVKCSLLPKQEQLNICQYLEGAVITVRFELSAFSLCWRFGDPRF